VIRVTTSLISRGRSRRYFVGVNYRCRSTVGCYRDDATTTWISSIESLYANWHIFSQHSAEIEIYPRWLFRGFLPDLDDNNDDDARVRPNVNNVCTRSLQ